MVLVTSSQATAHGRIAVALEAELAVGGAPSGSRKYRKRPSRSGLFPEVTVWATR